MKEIKSVNILSGGGGEPWAGAIFGSERQDHEKRKGEGWAGRERDVGTAPRVKRHRSRLRSKAWFSPSRARLYTRQALFRGSARLGLHDGRNITVINDNRRGGSDNITEPYR